MSRRVLILANALEGGGAESVARDMLEHLPNSACVLFENDSQIRVAGKHTWVASSKKNRTLLGKVWINLWRIVFIQVIKLCYRPAVTISHLEGPNFANLLTIGGKKKIVFVHNALSYSYSQDSIANAAKHFLAKMLYRHAGQIVGVSPLVCTELKENYSVPSEKVIYLPNPIDVRKIRSVSAVEYKDPLEHLVVFDYIICVGSLSVQKNHRLAILVFSILLRQKKIDQNIKLFIVGDGPLRVELIDFARSLGLVVADWIASGTGSRIDSSANVFFLGFQPSPYRLVKYAKLFWMTSLWEGLPISLLESLALETPIAISDCSSSLKLVMRDQKAASQGDLLSEGVEKTDCGWIVSISGDGPETIKIWCEIIVESLTLLRSRRSMERACLRAAWRHDVESVKDSWNVLF